MSCLDVSVINLSSENTERPFTVRCDPIHGWPVLYAPPRANRPFDFKNRAEMSCHGNDPFAEGNEAITPGETLAIRVPSTPADGPGWQVRIIPNKYPALVENGLGDATADTAFGLHEVVVECPQRETHFSRLSASQQELVFRAYRDRLQQLSLLPGLRHATLFKNHGQAAGASLMHTHSQLMASRFVSPMVQRELDFTAKYTRETGQDYFEDLLAREVSYQERIVEQTESFVVFCPAASRFGFEMQIVPRVAEPEFQATSDAMLQELAAVMRRCLKRLETVAGDPAYNWVLHTAPFAEQKAGGKTAESWAGFRWHWEIYPRIAGIAGWELGAGSFVNALYPEAAASLLRQIG